MFLGYWGRDYRIGSNFRTFYLIRIGFPLDELVCLVKVFRPFKLEQIVLGVQSVNTVGRCTTSHLLAGLPCLRCLVLWKKWHKVAIFQGFVFENVRFT
jgi:hypothetical protein